MYQSTQMIDLMQRAKGLSGEYENVVLSEFNDHVVRMSRMEKAYFWHFHPNSTRCFLVSRESWFWSWRINGLNWDRARCSMSLGAFGIGPCQRVVTRST